MPENITSTFNVPVDKLLENAEDTGTLVLSGRKMSIFPPTASSFDLTDVIEVDISQNRFMQLPESMSTMASLEKLVCFNNVLRQVPDLTSLESLVHLDLGRNHLSQIPAHLCRLPLKELIISHNRLVSLPDEIGNLSSLMDLDASGNELVSLPESMGHLINLRDLNVRRNNLVALPNALTSLQLVRLDISVNRIAQLPLSLIKMRSLMTLILHDNPLTLPPSNVCIRGRVHIFKYLKEELDKSKDGGSYSSRSSTRRENRVSRLRQRMRSSPLQQGLASPPPRTSRSLEEEMENLASKHGLDWSRKKQDKHDYAELEPLMLDNKKPDDDDDDKTPTCSPTRPIGPPVDLKEATSTPTMNGIRARGPPLQKPPPPAEIVQAKLANTKSDAKTSARGSPLVVRRTSAGSPRGSSRPVSSPSLGEKAATPPSRRAASVKNSPKQQRPLSGAPKPKLATKPSAQEIAAKTNTKRRLEMEWLEKQREQEMLSRQRQRELAMKRQAAEREQYIRNKEQNVRRLSSTSSSPTGPAMPPLDNQVEKSRQEQEEIMAAAEASRQNWQQRERAGTQRGPADSQDHLPDSKAPPPSMTKSSSFPKSAEYLERAPQLQQQRGIDRQYTVKRQEREAKKEFAIMDSLRKLLENALEQELPSNLMTALSDGVVLCNLVNQLRPNTISVIYTPPHRERAGGDGSAKLSMLKSVKNVDAFILGCKKIGLDSGLVCSPADILEMKDPLHVYITVRALVNRCSESRESAMV